MTFSERIDMICKDVSGLRCLLPYSAFNSLIKRPQDWTKKQNAVLLIFEASSVTVFSILWKCCHLINRYGV